MIACSVFPTKEAAVAAAATDKSLDNIAAWSSPGLTRAGLSNSSKFPGPPAVLSNREGEESEDCEEGVTSA